MMFEWDDTLMPVMDVELLGAILVHSAQLPIMS